MGKMETAKKLPPIEQLRSRTLGRVLIKMGVLTREKVHECLKIQKQRQGTILIGQIFLELGLIDEFQLCIHPVIAGKGLPLFKSVNNKSILKLLKTKSFNSGAIVLYYEPTE